MRNNKLILLIGVVMLFWQCQKAELQQTETSDKQSEASSKSLKSASVGEFTVLTYNIAGLPELISR
jgi:hypothetical protein